MMMCIGVGKIMLAWDLKGYMYRFYFPKPWRLYRFYFPKPWRLYRFYFPKP